MRVPEVDGTLWTVAAGEIPMGIWPSASRVMVRVVPWAPHTTYPSEDWGIVREGRTAWGQTTFRSASVGSLWPLVWSLTEEVV
jgi:hypothetical protein